jgi:hypothetical protein
MLVDNEKGGNKKERKKKLSMLREKIATGINNSMLNLTKHHKRVIESGIHDILVS